MTRQISKTAQLKADRAARQAQRDAARIAARDRLLAARADAKEACSKIPPEFQQWGIVRTRAFMNMVEILNYRAGLVTIKAAELEAYTRHLRSVSTMPLDQCQELSEIHVHARLGEGSDTGFYI